MAVSSGESRVDTASIGASLYGKWRYSVPIPTPARRAISLALGINVAAIAGSFIGLVVGGVLAPVAWRLVFLVSVPIGLFGTVWAYRKLGDLRPRRHARIDWWGNVTFALGLIAVMVGITYGIQPYGGHTMGWTAPGVLAALVGGVA